MVDLKEIAKAFNNLKGLQPIKKDNLRLIRACAEEALLR
jgi:hypothetical protein